MLADVSGLRLHTDGENMANRTPIKLGREDTVTLQRKEYVLYRGLLRLAHENGLESTCTKLHTYDPANNRAIVTATVTGTRGSYTGIGDADTGNVKRGMDGAVIRMAETRAICRALRVYLGIGMTAAEELPGESKPARSKAFRTPTMVDTQASGCAVCGKLVSNGQAKASQDEHKLVMCEEHAEVWGQDPHGSWAVDAESFIDALQSVEVELDTLDLRCMASPRWGQRPRHMNPGQRETMLRTLREHYARKRELG